MEPTDHHHSGSSPTGGPGTNRKRWLRPLRLAASASFFSAVGLGLWDEAHSYTLIQIVLGVIGIGLLLLDMRQKN